jgi:hypothetical protein
VPLTVIVVVGEMLPLVVAVMLVVSGLAAVMVIDPEAALEPVSAA